MNYLRPSLIFSLLGLISAVLLADGGGKDDLSRLRRVIDQTSEKSIYAKIKVSNGEVFVGRDPLLGGPGIAGFSGNIGQEGKVFAGDFLFGARPPLVAYEVVGDEGRLAVRFSEKSKKDKNDDVDIDFDNDSRHYKISIDQIYDNECRLNFSDRLPMILKMDLGVTKGDFELGGLQLSECEITSAVSKTNINFSDPNPIELREFIVESGVGSLHLSKLSNANFSFFRFSGGVGSYSLDFSGHSRSAAHAEVEIGMGKLDIYLPRSLGVRISVDRSFLSSCSIDEVYKEGDTYYNANWGKAASNLDLKIDSGVAKIAINWID